MDNPGKIMEQGMAETDEVLRLRQQIKQQKIYLRQAQQLLRRQNNQHYWEMIALRELIADIGNCWASIFLPHFVKTRIDTERRLPNYPHGR